MADVDDGSADVGESKSKTAADAVNASAYVKEDASLSGIDGDDNDDEIIVVCEQTQSEQQHQQVNSDDRPFASDGDDTDSGDSSSSDRSASDDEQGTPMFRGFEHLDIRNSQYTREMVGRAATELQMKMGQLFKGFQRCNNNKVAALKIGCPSSRSGCSGSRVVFNGVGSSNDGGDDMKPSKKLLLAAVKQRLNSTSIANGITAGSSSSRSLAQASSTFVVPNIKVERSSPSPSSTYYDGERPEWKQRTWQSNEQLRPIFSPLQAWEYFVNDSMLNDIVQFTNEDSASTSVRITLAELKAVFAILYATCVYDERRFSPERFFSPSGGTAIDLCAALMPYKRFRMILAHLKLAARKKVTVDEHRCDPLAPVRDLLNTFLINCRRNYRLGGELVIREKVQFFRGKCDFVRDRHKVKGVKTKCGMRLFCLVDASNGYVYNAAVSTGDKEPFGTERHAAATNETVKQLLRPVYGSGRVVVTDENLTDLSLCSDLFKDYRLKTIGAIRKNRCLDIHREHLSDVHGLPSFSSRFVTGQYVTLVAYVPRRGEVVRVVSTAHRGKEIDPNSGNLKRPRIVSDYNRIVAGVSAFYEREKLPDRKAVSWPVGVLYGLLDIALLNSYVLYRRRPENQTIVDFAQQLALLLAKDFMIERLNKLRSSSSVLDVESKLRLARLAQTFDDRIGHPSGLLGDAVSGLRTDHSINPIAYSGLERSKSTVPPSTTTADAEHDRCRQLSQPFHAQPFHDGTAVTLSDSVPSDDLNNTMIRGRCDVCPRSRDRKTKFRCIFCGIRVCGEHSLVICEQCNFHKKRSSSVRLPDSPPPPASSDSESEVLQV